MSGRAVGLIQSSQKCTTSLQKQSKTKTKILTNINSTGLHAGRDISLCLSCSVKHLTAHKTLKQEGVERAKPCGQNGHQVVVCSDLSAVREPHACLVCKYTHMNMARWTINRCSQLGCVVLVAIFNVRSLRSLKENMEMMRRHQREYKPADNWQTFDPRKKIKKMTKHRNTIDCQIGRQIDDSVITSVIFPPMSIHQHSSNHDTVLPNMLHS